MINGQEPELPDLRSDDTKWFVYVLNPDTDINDPGEARKGLDLVGVIRGWNAARALAESELEARWPGQWERVYAQYFFKVTSPGSKKPALILDFDFFQRLYFELFKQCQEDFQRERTR